MSPFVPKKSPNSAKVNYSFHWKLKGDWALIFTDLDSLMAIFDFGHFQGANWGQSWNKNSNITVKILVLQNALNVICTTVRTTCGQKFSSIRCYLLELLPTKTPKWAQIGPEPKKCSGFFWLKLKTTNTQKLKLGIQNV